MIRDAKVLTLDLRDGQDVPASFEELVAREKAVASEEGVVRPWNLLLIESVENLAKHEGLYTSILQSSARPRLIVLLVGEIFDRVTSLPKVGFPSVFQEHRAQLRVLAVTSLGGCEWSSGAPLPSGVGHWAGDPDGNTSVPILVEPIAIEEVFNSLFSGTSKAGFDAWSVGTKQVWFGRLPAKATADSLHETGQALVGDDGDATLLPRVDEWEIPPALDGTAHEPDILTLSDGSILEHYQGIRRQISAEKLMFGISGNSGSLRRVAKFSEHHIRTLSQIEARAGSVEEVVKDLLASIDAGDGFNEDESRWFDRLGIVIKRQDNYRAVYREAATQLNDRVVDGVRDWIKKGHSIAPLILTIENTIEKIRPQSQNQILENFDAVSFATIREKLLSSGNRKPKGTLVRVAVAVARVLQPTWARVLLAFLYSWFVGVGVWEIADHGRSKWLLPVPRAVREQVANLFTLGAIVVTLVVVALGLVVTYADNQIRRWGKTVGLIELEKAVQSQQEFIERVTLNEWVLSRTRRRTATSMEYLNQTLRGLSEIIRQKLIENHSELARTVLASENPNPAVRRDLNDVAAAGTFMQLDKVVEILRTDISTLIDDVLSLRIHEFKGVGGASVPSEINDSIAGKIDRFVSRLIIEGPLSLDVALSREAIALRKSLIETYWKNVSIVSSAVHNSALTSADAVFIQFVAPTDLLHLDQQPDETVIVRFAPEPSRDEIHELAANSDMKVIFTETTACAGVLRLTGFRNPFIEKDGIESTAYSG